MKLFVKLGVLYGNFYLYMVSEFLFHQKLTQKIEITAFFTRGGDEEEVAEKGQQSDIKSIHK